MNDLFGYFPKSEYAVFHSNVVGGAVKQLNPQGDLSGPRTVKAICAKTIVLACVIEGLIFSPLARSETPEGGEESSDQAILTSHVSRGSELPAAENSDQQDDTKKKGFTMLAMLASDYIWRGVSQTHRTPALQPEIDFDWFWGDDTMLNAGVWASNIRYPGYPSAKLEIESWVNLTRNLVKGVSLTVETLRYDYPNAAKLSYPEISATAGWRNGDLPLEPELTLQYAWTWDTYGTGTGSFYTDMTLKLALAHGWGLVSHYGHSRFSDQAVDRDYDDWKLGLSHAALGGDAELGYFYSNASQYGRDAAGHFVLSWMHTF